MKKSLLMFGLAIVAMSSCTNDEVVEMNQSNAIRFESFVNKGTRAVTQTTNEISKFYVFGYHDGDTNPVFNNVEVSKTGDEWGYTDEKYWRANTYYFGAYATNNTSSNTANASFSNNGTLTITDYSVGSMTGGETHSTDDLVGAVKTVDNGNLQNETVGLTFKHLLSQVKFELYNNNAGFYMTVSDITFKAMPTGTCTMSSAESINWTLKAGLTNSDSLTYTYPGTGEDTYIEAGKSFISDSYLVLPVAIAGTTRANFTISFYERLGEGTEASPYSYNLMQEIPYNNISLVGTNGPTDNEEGNYTDGDNVTSWTPGYIYNYKASFPVNPSLITFSASVDPWKDDQVDDNTVNGPTVEF